MFKPIIKLVQIPRTQDSFVVQDATGNNPANPTGFGSNDGPATPDAITAVWGKIQNYGALPGLPAALTGNITAGLTAVTGVNTGVSTIYIVYGELLSSIPWSLSLDRKTITLGSDPGTQFISADSISLNSSSYPIPISSINSANIILTAALPGEQITGTGIYRCFTASLNVLVIYRAEGELVRCISHLPIGQDRLADIELNRIMEKLLLKVAAELNFASGKWSLAHEAACLASDLIPVSTSNKYVGL